MASNGQVIGGQYMNSMIDTNRKSEIVVHFGFKSRKLDEAEVTQWQEVAPESTGIATRFGQAVAGAALPGFVGRAASAAVEAGVELANSQRLIRVEWVDSKQSLIKLPQKLFTHLSVLLERRRVEPTEERGLNNSVEEIPLNAAGQIIAETGRVVTDIVGAIKDRRVVPAEIEVSPQSNLMEQIAKLGDLRDQGILTDEEFSAKKAELLSRL
jgi:hypothetical protein